MNNKTAGFNSGVTSRKSTINDIDIKATFGASQEQFEGGEDDL